MSSLRKRRTLAILAVLIAALLAYPTLSLGTAAAQEKGSRPPSAESPARDTPDRPTPRSTMAAFLDATSSRDYGRAAEHLDLSRIPRDTRAEAGPVLARELRIVLDQTISIDLEALSDQPEGSPQEGVPADRALIGTIASKTRPVRLLLQRMPGEGDLRTWKVSAATVAQIPRLYREFGYGPLGDYLPPTFFEVRFLDVALWQWLALILLVGLSSGLAWVGTVVALRVLRPLAGRAAPVLGGQIVTVISGPLRFTIGVLAFFVGSALLNLSIPAHRFFVGIEKALVIIIVAWFVLRMIDVLGDLATARLLGAGRPTATAVVPLGRKATKVIIVALALLAVLQNVGINVTGVLAGLGIGGLAVALAAQKTVENLFGGVTLILDQPVRVGDFCRFGDKIGTVEEVGLRSTRVRTLDRTVVSIPNGHFSSLELENFAPRDRIWLHTTLGLRYETTPDQLRHVLVEIRRMLYAHAKVDTAAARIRFVSFDVSSLGLEIFAYARTSDYDEFLAIREDIYLRIMDIVAESGTGFAFPSQTTYLARDGGLDEAKRKAAEAQVQAWRAEGSLHLPDFPPDAIAALDGTIEYPPRGATSARRS
jgi:MscS family membrane protein